MKYKIKYFPSVAHEKSEFLSFNSLPNDKILDWSKLKAFADDKTIVTQKLKLSCEK